MERVRTRGPSTDGHGVRPASIPDRKGGSASIAPAILREVWGLSQDVDTRAIDNFIVRSDGMSKIALRPEVSPNGPRRRLPLRPRALTGPLIKWPEWLPATIEADGHLIDSGLLSAIFDKIIEFRLRRIVTFDIGRTNDDASHIKMRINAADASSSTISFSSSRRSAVTRCASATRWSSLPKRIAACRTTFIRRRTIAHTCG